MNWKNAKEELPKSNPEKRVQYLCDNGSEFFVARWRGYKTGPGFENDFGEVIRWAEIEKPINKKT